jgi:hypothetical protein
VLGDDLFGRFGGDWCAVAVADDVGHGPVHHGPGAFGQAAGDYAERLSVVGAPLDDLGLVQPGLLRILLRA